MNEVISKEIAQIKRDNESLKVLASAVAIATQNPDVLSTNPLLKEVVVALEYRVVRLEELMKASKEGDSGKVLKLYMEICRECDRT